MIVIMMMVVSGVAISCWSYNVAAVSGVPLSDDPDYLDLAHSIRGHGKYVPDPRYL